MTPDAAAFEHPETRPSGSRNIYTINDEWVAEDRRKLLAFARDLLNSDYAGHRLTFQLFAQSPPFAHSGGRLSHLRLERPARIRAEGGRPLRPHLGCMHKERPPEVMTAHQNAISPFNTKDTYPEQKLDNDLCQAVVARGTMVFLRGQVSQDLDTRQSLHVGDATAQTAKTMANIKLLMEEAGGSLDHICRIVVYLTDIRYREAVYREMGKWLKGVFPCSTGLVITALARPEWIVEIEVTAVIPTELICIPRAGRWLIARHATAMRGTRLQRRHGRSADCFSRPSRAQSPLEEAFTIPPAIYSSAEIHASSASASSPADWLCPGLAADIPKPGDYITFAINDQPFFAIRGKDGHIRSFSNVCLHRMMTLLAGSRQLRPHHLSLSRLDL